MILVDTSVWIDHLRKGDKQLDGLLRDARVLCHPFVVGELACGNLSNRDRILDLLSALPRVRTATDLDVLALVSTRELHGRGIGWIDAHLLAGALLSRSRVWTRDRSLASAAAALDLAYR